MLSGLFFYIALALEDEIVRMRVPYAMSLFNANWIDAQLRAVLPLIPYELDGGSQCMQTEAAKMTFERGHLAD